MPVHNIPPCFNKESKILVLGSFPSIKSREAKFFYGHPQNRFWRVMERLFDVSDLNETEVKREFLLKHHIAAWDVIKSCDIVGSADDTIENVVPNDLSVILDEADIQTIYVNGTKAFEMYEKYTKPKLKEKYGRVANAVKLPSTSPANAAWSLDKLVPVWSRILIGLNCDFNNRVLEKEEKDSKKTKRPDKSIKPNQKSYLSVSDYCQMKFGKKLYKLSINAGFTCPNRDGTLGTEGCAFCEGGNSDFTGTIEEQKKLIESKLPKNKKTGYIAYFGSFTNTYAEPLKLKEIYREALENPEIDVISIATRPDCLGKEVLKVLEEMNQVKPVWVELGLQTIHEKTAKYIRRGYRLPVYNKAVKDLQRIGISQIITHIIIGLPNETSDMLLKTVRHVSEAGSNGIKLQLLHVVEGTDLAKDFSEGKFKVLSLEEYASLVKACINELPPDMVIHRITGDGNHAKLIAPEWSKNKKKVLNFLNLHINED